MRRRYTYEIRLNGKYYTDRVRKSEAVDLFNRLSCESLDNYVEVRRHDFLKLTSTLIKSNY